MTSFINIIIYIHNFSLYIFFFFKFRVCLSVDITRNWRFISSGFRLLNIWIRKRHNLSTPDYAICIAMLVFTSDIKNLQWIYPVCELHIVQKHVFSLQYSSITEYTHYIFLNNIFHKQNRLLMNHVIRMQDKTAGWRSGLDKFILGIFKISRWTKIGRKNYILFGLLRKKTQ